MHPRYLFPVNPPQALPSKESTSPSSTPLLISHSPNTASKAVTSRSLNTRWKVATQGVCPRLNPNSCPVVTPWSRPHWAMAYKLRAPHSMAQTAKLKTAPKG